jgi:hypothetical protein
MVMLFQKFVDAWENKDAQAELDLYHDDWEMTFHSTGKILKKHDMSLADREKMMENIHLYNRRCIYENEDILVMHSMTDFPNGTTDAVMMVITKKDGLFWRTETGSIPISKE